MSCQNHASIVNRDISARQSVLRSVSLSPVRRERSCRMVRHPSTGLNLLMAGADLLVGGTGTRPSLASVRRALHSHMMIHSGTSGSGERSGGFYSGKRNFRTLLLVTGAAGLVAAFSSMHGSSCDAALAREGKHEIEPEVVGRHIIEPASSADPSPLLQHTWSSIGWVVLRLMRHVLVFLPLGMLYVPCRFSGARAHDIWWGWFIFAIESSGPALVKVGQWAATRTDMFPADLCGHLSQLHSGARTHPSTFSEDALRGILEDSPYVLVRIDEKPIGSGCIAQVTYLKRPHACTHAMCFCVSVHLFVCYVSMYTHTC
jgi:aarF domain-containing kinase